MNKVANEAMCLLPPSTESHTSWPDQPAQPAKVASILVLLSWLLSRKRKSSAYDQAELWPGVFNQILFVVFERQIRKTNTMFSLKPDNAPIVTETHPRVGANLWNSGPAVEELRYVP